MRCARGQGTVEYLAVVLLVAVVLGAAATAMPAGPGARIATAVPHRLLYAICRVTGGDCDRDRAPCDVGSLTAAHRWSVTVAVIKVGHRRVLVQERRSDGKVVVTETTAPLGGLEATAGTGAKIRLGRRTLALGGEATAALVGAYGRGRTWVLDDDRAARALVARLQADDPVPPADSKVTQGDLQVDGTVARGDDRGGITATLGVAGGLGRRDDRATGARTYYFEGGFGGEAQVSLRAVRGSAAAAGADRERYALTVARDGRWLDLATVRTGEISGTVTLPTALRPVAEALNVPTAGGRRWVAESHLDLTDPASLAAARAFVAALRAVPPRPAALLSAREALAGRLDERGVVHVRTYALERTAKGFDVRAGAGLGVGGSVQDTTEHTRLIAATTRGLDGQWRRRDDCLQEV
ncbi:MAG TPA: hypothetical protein VHF51_15815 [Solirubrobacteraceae bacterium]|nr:hypothetical protein [Solirubrobacteraceae bacterium]